MRIEPVTYYKIGNKVERRQTIAIIIVSQYFRPQGVEQRQMAEDGRYDKCGNNGQTNKVTECSFLCGNAFQYRQHQIDTYHYPQEPKVRRPLEHTDESNLQPLTKSLCYHCVYDRPKEESIDNPQQILAKETSNVKRLVGRQE